MIESMSPAGDVPVSGFLGNESFCGQSSDIVIPSGPVTSGAAMVGAGIKGKTGLVDPCSREEEFLRTTEAFLSLPAIEGMVSPLFGSAIVRRESGLFIARDPLGTKPMFTSSGKIPCAASDPRALEVAHGRVIPLKPSTFYDLGGGPGISTHMRVPKIQAGVKIGEVIDELLAALRSFIEALPPPRALFFSGGIDSLILAKICGEIGETTLISAGIEGCKDLSRARSVAGEIPCPLVSLKIPVSSIPGDVEILERINPTAKPMNVAIALPILHAARAAAEMEINTAIAGHGADELFGGYHRYISEADPRPSMLTDLLNLHSRGMTVCDLASRGNKVDLYLPFLDQSIVELALSLPTRHLIGKSGRKILLRKTGVRMGLSKKSVMAKKCAIQYGSGVNKHVFRLLGGRKE